MVSMTAIAQTDSKGYLTASPTVGTAPLEVTFTGTGSGMMEGVMLLDFGDGQTDDSISPIRDFTRKHTYAAAGTYTVELKGGAYGGRRPSILTVLGSGTMAVHLGGGPTGWVRCPRHSTASVSPPSTHTDPPRSTSV